MEQEYAEDIRNAFRDLNLPCEQMAYTVRGGARRRSANPKTDPS